MENEIENKYKEYKAWNTKSNFAQRIANMPFKENSQEDKEDRKFLNWLFDEMLKDTDKKELPKEHSRNDLFNEFISFSDSICQEDKSKFFTLPNSEKIYLNFGTQKDLINDLTKKNWSEFIKQLKIKNMNDNISEIEKDLNEISDFSQKINYLINVKSKYEIKVAGFSEIEKAWLGDLSKFPKQCDALISKYENLLKYSVAPETNKPAPDTENSKLICDKKLLQKLHAEFDGEIWESVELETFLNYMRVDPIGQIQKNSDNRVFAEWLRENIENVRDKKLVPNFGNWFKKLIGKEINYSTFFHE